MREPERGHGAFCLRQSLLARGEPLIDAPMTTLKSRGRQGCLSWRLTLCEIFAVQLCLLLAHLREA